jgi:hypothetical protein
VLNEYLNNAFLAQLSFASTVVSMGWISQIDAFLAHTLLASIIARNLQLSDWVCLMNASS